MNDELPEEGRRDPGSSGSSSRWAIAPGSVVKSLKDQRRRHRHAAPDPTAEPTGKLDGKLTGKEPRSPRTPTEDGSVPRSRTRSAADILAATRARRADSPAASPSPAAAYGLTGKDTPAAATSQKPATRETAPSSRAGRARPELGEPRELRQSPAVGTSPGTVLAGFGGVILIILTTGVGALVDHLITSKLGVFTGIGLCVGSFFAALVTRKIDLLSVIVAPPIVYGLYGVLLIWLSPTVIDKYSLAEIAISGFPWMSLATGIALVIGGIKLMTTKNNERR